MRKKIGAVQKCASLVDKQLQNEHLIFACKHRLRYRRERTHQNYILTFSHLPDLEVLSTHAIVKGPYFAASRVYRLSTSLWRTKSTRVQGPKLAELKAKRYDSALKVIEGVQVLRVRVRRTDALAGRQGLWSALHRTLAEHTAQRPFRSGPRTGPDVQPLPQPRIFQIFPLLIAARTVPKADQSTTPKGEASLRDADLKSRREQVLWHII